MNGLILAAFVVSAEIPGPGAARMEMQRYESDKVVLYYRSCGAKGGNLATSTWPRKKPIKGCWFAYSSTIQVGWENGDIESFELNQFNFFTKEAAETGKQLGDM